MDIRNRTLTATDGNDVEIKVLCLETLSQVGKGWKLIRTTHSSDFDDFTDNRVCRYKYGFDIYQVIENPNIGIRIHDDCGDLNLLNYGGYYCTHQEEEHLIANLQ